MIPATSSIPYDPKTMINIGPIYAEASSFYLFGMLPMSGIGGDTAQKLLSDMTAANHCDTVINTVVEVEESQLLYAVLFNRKVRVSGIGIKFRDRPKLQLHNDANTKPEDRFVGE
jgi:hypothetical protein